MTDDTDRTILSQKEAFLEGEGNAYYERNKDKWRLKGDAAESDDPVLRVLDRLGPFEGAILEIGCGACDRLQTIRAKNGVACSGIDPSSHAIDAARRTFPALDVHIGTADALPFQPKQFSVVILGYFLYLVDPADYFSVAREADRVLSNNGLLLIHDFSTPTAYANTYVHRPEILTRKMDWSRMFTWNPSYSLIHRELLSSAGVRDPDERVTVDVLVKDAARQFPKKG